LILLDPLVAVVLDVTALQEQLRLAPVPIAFGVAGVVLTARGIGYCPGVTCRSKGEGTESNATRAVQERMRPTEEQHGR
jgi:hypothetical protein